MGIRQLCAYFMGIRQPCAYFMGFRQQCVNFMGNKMCVVSLVGGEKIWVGVFSFPNWQKIFKFFLMWHLFEAGLWLCHCMRPRQGPLSLQSTSFWTRVAKIWITFNFSMYHFELMLNKVSERKRCTHSNLMTFIFSKTVDLPGLYPSCAAVFQCCKLLFYWGCL